MPDWTSLRLHWRIVHHHPIAVACCRGRDCSAPFAICPYKGKYSVGRSTPDSLASQKLLAGMADRGATSAVIECTSTGIQNGRCVLLSSLQQLSRTKGAGGQHSVYLNPSFVLQAA